MASVVKDSVTAAEDALEMVIPGDTKGFQEGNDKYEFYDTKLFEENEERRADPENINYIYCIVFSCVEEKPSGMVNKVKGLCKELPVTTVAELEDTRIEILKKIEEAGFVTQSVYNSTKDKVIVKIGCNDKRLLTEAELREHRLELNPISLKYVLELKVLEDDPNADVDKPKHAVYMDYENYTQAEFVKILNQGGEGTLPLFRDRDNFGTLTDEPVSLESAKTSFLNQCKEDPFKHIHFRYDMDWEEKIAADHRVQLYKKYRDGTILRTTDRIDLLSVALARDDTARKGVKGAGLNLKNLLFTKKIKGHYPLEFNDQIRRSKDIDAKEIYRKFQTKLCFGCSMYIPFSQPVQDVRDYCGEKVAYYFAFLEFYSKWLLFSSFFGIIMFGFQLVNMQIQMDRVDPLNPIDVRGPIDITAFVPGDEELFEFLSDADGGSEFINERTPIAISEDNAFALFVLTPTEIGIFIPIFSGFIALWGALFLEFWKRKQAALAFKWGVSSFETTAEIRPEFKSQFDIPDAVTGLPTPYRSLFWFGAYLTLSVVSMLTLVAATVAAFTATYVFKAFMSADTFLDPTIAVQIALVINSFVIIGLGIVFKKVGKWLTDLENHRTDIQYEDSLILKIFVFSFFNSYTTLMYFAFIKSGTNLSNQNQYCSADLEDFENNGDEEGIENRIFSAEELFKVDSCYGALGYSLVIIFFSQIVINNTMEIGFPILGNFSKAVSSKTKIRKRNADAAENGEQKLEEGEVAGPRRLPLKSPAENQFLLAQYSTPFYDYLELALQFGYVTLFVAAFPLAPVLALLNNFIEVWVDANKVFKQSRRPAVQRAQDIGSWYRVFEVLSYIAIITNGAVLVFTSVEIIPVDPDREENRVWAFLGFIIGVFTIKYVVDLVILDTPAWVNVMLKRQAHYEQKIFFDTEDDFDKYAVKAGKAVLEDDEKDVMMKDIEKFMPLENDPYMDQLIDEVKEKMNKLGVTKEDLFNRINTDNRDTINLRELKTALESEEYGVGQEVEPLVISHFVNALDLDGDGKISQQELAIFLDDGTNAEGEPEDEV